MSVEDLKTWIDEAAAIGSELEVRWTGRYIGPVPVLRVTSVKGEIAEITVEEYATAKALTQEDQFSVLSNLRRKLSL